MRDSRTFEYHFGPQWTPEGVVFRLWGPAAEQVALVLESVPPVPMERDRNGWWSSPPQAVTAGTAYWFKINGEHLVPDPASRRQKDDVHGASVLTSPSGQRTRAAFSSGNNLTGSQLSEGGRSVDADAWRGRPWEETVLYELHVGASDRYGTFSTVKERLPALAELGVTAVELMPVADFPGSRNWGYDGVLPFAPDRAYGSPEELHVLVDAAHTQGLTIWLDVVYNHFGPEGNYLHLYAPQFFTEEIHTPWGAAIDFSVPEVRRFFIENALYWLEEFRFDGLRLDAVHAIHDASEVHFLNELASTVRSVVPSDRHVHLVLENDRNEARFLGSRPDQYTAQWNDDIHHAWHVLLTGEHHGYYRGYAASPENDLIRALTTGFVYQGEPFPVEGDEDGAPRGEPSDHLSPIRFISFLQNHDQIGNRAYGERLITLASQEALTAAVVTHLLSPQIPLLFMGEPYGVTEPFQFFCAFGKELSRAVRDGRRREFGLDDLPDPAGEDVFLRSIPSAGSDNEWATLYRVLLDLRRQYLVPILHRVCPGAATGGGPEAVAIYWEPGWMIECNLSPNSRRPATARPGDWADENRRKPVYDSGTSLQVSSTKGNRAGTGGSVIEPEHSKESTDPNKPGLMPPWSVRVYRSIA